MANAIQTSQSSNFQPKWGSTETSGKVAHYKIFPHLYDDNQKNEVEEHAHYWGLPFSREDTNPGVIGLLKEAGKGYAEGFTTLSWGKQPYAKSAQIARSLGHLAGFAGMTGAPIAKALGASSKTQRMIAGLQGKSLPMLGAKFVTEKSKKLASKFMSSAHKGSQSAKKDAMGFLSQDWAKDSIEGAVHLGVASAISTQQELWKGNVDAVLQSALHGAYAGAVFRGIGNAIGKGAAQGEKNLRAIAGSLFQGMPSTMRGDTDVDQIYNYVLGAYFGYNETPYSLKQGKKHAFKTMKERANDPTKGPEDVKGWEGLSEASQKVAKETLAEKGVGDYEAAQAFFMQMTDKATREKIIKFENKKLPPDMEFIGYDYQTGEPVIRKRPEFADKTVIYRKEGNRLETEIIEKGSKILNIDTPRDLLRMLSKKDVEGAKKILRKYDEAKAREFLHDYFKGDYDYIKFNYNAQPNRKPVYWELKKQPEHSFGRRFSEDPNAIVGKTIKSPGRDDATGASGIINESDVGGTPVISYGNQAESIVKKTKKREIDAMTGEKKDKYVKEMSAKVQDVLNKINPKTKTEDIVKEVNDAILGIMPKAEEGRLRRHIKEIKDGKGIVYVDYIDGKVQINYGNKSVMGNDRAARDPLKEYEKIYYEITGEKPDKSDRPVVMHENFTIINEKGRTEEFDLKGFRTHLLRKNEWNVQDAHKEYMTAFRQIMKHMDDLGYYYMGGKGDKEMNIFMKKHPDLKTIKSEAPGFISQKIGKAWLTEKNALNDAFLEGLKGEEHSRTKKMLEDAYWSNVGYDMDFNGFNKKNPEHYKLLYTHPGFLKSAKDYNKRAQILFTTGYSNDANTFEGLPNVTKDGNIRIIIVKDDPAGEERTDGIFLMHDKVIEKHGNNGGVFEGGKEGDGQVKSMLVRRGRTNGGLLGKYMVHSSGESLSKLMESGKIHGIMFESAVKQQGLRESHSYEDYKSGKIDQNKVYEISPKDLKVIGSEITDSHMSAPQRIAKQMWSNFTPFLYSAKTPAEQEKVLKTFEDMFDTLVGNSYRGEESWNKKLKELHKTKDEVLEDSIINNLEKVSVEDLFAVMNSPEHSRFAVKVYRKLLDSELETMSQELGEAELDSEQVNRYRAEIRDFDSVVDKMINNVDSGKDIGVFLHKYSRPMMLTVKKNYMLSRAVKPKLDNSVVSRIRGMDHHVIEDIKKENGSFDSDKFYLDNGHKYMKVKVDWAKEKTLGELWKNRNKYDADVVKEYFTSIGVRIPMASMSGARQMEFGGFTGRKGHGVVMNELNMRALGGADNDGDKAYNFFGFKKSWRDLYHKNKDELLENGVDWQGDKIKEWQEGRDKILRDATPEERKIEQRVGKSITEIYNSRSSKFSPFARMQMSTAAQTGRAQLGPAVVQSSILQAMHAHISAMKDGVFLHEGMTRKGKPIQIMITPKKDLMKFRKMKNALIGYTADPMDEIGLKSIPDLFTHQYNTLFDTVVIINGRRMDNKGQLKTGVNNGFNQSVGSMSWIKNTDVYSSLAKVNSALWGKNMEFNKQWDSLDITTKAEEGSRFTQNTYMPIVSQLVKKTDMSESIFKRISQPKLDALYKEYNMIRKELAKFPQFKELLESMEREGFSVLPPDMKKIFKNYLHDDIQLYRISKDESRTKDILKTGNIKEKDIADYLPKDSWQEGQELPLYWGTKLQKGKKYHNLNLWKVNKMFELMSTSSGRREMLKKYRDAQEAKITNDLTDIISGSWFYKLLQNPKFKIGKFKEIYNKTEEFKKDHAALFKADRKREPTVIDPELEDMRAKTIAPKYQGKQPGRLKTTEEINIAIKEYKKTLSSYEKKLFDGLMLQSFNKGKPTSVSKLGFQSDQISNQSTRSFLNEFNRVYRQIERGAEKTKEKEKSEKVLDELVDDVYTKRKIKLPDGTTVEGGVNDPMKVVDDLEPFAAIVDPKKALKYKFKKEDLEMMARIRDNLAKLHGSAAEDIVGMVKGALNKDISAMDMMDWRTFDNIVQDMVDGPMIGKIFSSIDNGEKIPKWWYFGLPRNVSRDMIKKDMVLLKRKGVYWTRDGNMKITQKTGDVYIPYTHLSAFQEYVHASNGFASQSYVDIKTRFDDSFRFMDSLRADGEPFGTDLFRIAVSEMEYPIAKKMNKQEDRIPYLENYKKHNKIFNKIKDKIWKFKDVKDDATYEMSTREVVDLFKTRLTEFNKEMHEKYIRADKSAIKKYAKKVNGEVVSRETGEILDIENMSVREIMKKDPELDVAKFQKDIADSLREGKRPQEDLGMDFMEMIHREAMIQSAPKDFVDPKTNKLISPKLLLLARKLKPTGEYDKIGDWSTYFPHIFQDRKVAYNQYLKSAKDIKENPKLTKEQKEQRMVSLVLRHQARTGEWTMEHGDKWMSEMWDNALEAIKNKQGDATIKWIDSFNKPGNLFTREEHAPGWSLDPISYSSYIRGITDAYYRKISQFMGRRILEDFKGRMEARGDVPKELINAWHDFIKLYGQNAMGHPSVIPKEMLENPRMNLDGTAFKWFADSEVAKQVNKMKDLLGMKEEGLPEGFKEITYQQIKNFSSLEAKYQLASLLAHPKTAVGNIYGGTTHTMVSTGFKNWKNGRNLEYLRTKINPEWDSWEKIERFVQEQGINEEFLIAELELNPQAKSKKFGEFVRDAAKQITGDPNMSDRSLRGLAKEHGVTDAMFNKFAWFMKKSERMLRRDAFMAHLVQAHENFGGALEYNNPELIRLAKQGVKATQFLYSAPFRPMFASTSLGKVLSRFQLWSYNSVDFRRNTLRQAAIYGINPESTEMKRLERLMMLDIFSLSLASLFPYSVFNAALPAPWNWAQDTMEWLFGDEKTRNKAFWGDKSMWPKNLRPLQMVTPPLVGKIGRSSQDAWIAWTSGSWEKMANYSTATLFPGGRFARDIKRSIENPGWSVEYMTGLPLQTIGSTMKKGGSKKPF